MLFSSCEFNKTENAMPYDYHVIESSTTWKEQFFTYKNLLKNGLEYIRNKDSIIVEVRRFQNGKLNGNYLKYYDKGDIATIGKFINDKKIGKWHEFHPNGEIKSSGKYADGLKSGLWKCKHRYL
jgi:antitoxin component YwqK of YwqJK toxin-antitoxin module